MAPGPETFPFSHVASAEAEWDLGVMWRCFCGASSFSQISHLGPTPTAQPMVMGGSQGNVGEPGPLATRDDGSARPTQPTLRGQAGEA